jgi:hypothetical protein
MGSIDEPATLHKYAYAADDPVNRIDPTGMQELGEVMAALAIGGILMTMSNTLINGFSGNGWWPDAALYGLSATFSVAGNVAKTGLGAANLGLGAVNAAGLFSLLFGNVGNDAIDQIKEVFGPTLALALVTALTDLAGGALGAGSSIAQLTYTIGVEVVDTATDGQITLWGLHGPGISLGKSTDPVSVSATVYGGVVWHVEHALDYAGPFIYYGGTLPFGGGMGISEGYFFSKSDARQNGVSTGFTVGATSISASFGETNYSVQAGPSPTLLGLEAKSLLALAWPPLYGILLELKAYHKL